MGITWKRVADFYRRRTKKKKKKERYRFTPQLFEYFSVHVSDQSFRVCESINSNIVTLLIPPNTFVFADDSIFTFNVFIKYRRPFRRWTRTIDVRTRRTNTVRKVRVRSTCRYDSIWTLQTFNGLWLRMVIKTTTTIVETDNWRGGDTRREWTFLETSTSRQCCLLFITRVRFSNTVRFKANVLESLFKIPRIVRWKHDPVEWQTLIDSENRQTTT